MNQLIDATLIENKVIREHERKLVYHINRVDKTKITTQLFRDVHQQFSNRYGNNNIMLRAVNNTGVFTYKGFRDIDLNLDEMEDYYENKVKSIKEFDYWYSIEVTILKKE